MNIFSMTFILSSLLKFDNVSENKMNIIRNDYIQYITRVVKDANENYNNLYIYDNIKTRFYLDNVDMYNDHYDHYDEFVTYSDIEPIPDAAIIPVEEKEDEEDEEDEEDDEEDDDDEVEIEIEIEVELQHKEL